MNVSRSRTLTALLAFAALVVAAAAAEAQRGAFTKAAKPNARQAREMESPPPPTRTETPTTPRSGSSRRHDGPTGSGRTAGKGKGSFATTQGYSGASRIDRGGILGAKRTDGSSARRLLHNPRPIRMTRSGVDKIKKRHMEEGAELDKQRKSYFDRGEDLDALVKRAEGQPAFFQPKTGHYQRVVRVPNRTVGTLSKNLGGQRTNIYTVVTSESGDLLNAYPGRPHRLHSPH